MAFQREAARIAQLSQPSLRNIALCSIGEAALAKYIINSFLATKVVFMNEMYQLAETQGYSWQKVRSLIDTDERIGRSHTRVPGPDGTFGFGGMCFPKDTLALLEYAKQQSVQLNVLDSAVKKNLLLRLTEPPK
jgi:UDPglucose 6-dehydrogenase